LSKRSRHWLEKHRADPYVRAATAGDWRSRAVFKLAQIDERDRLLKPGMTVVDLGAAPGGWSQYCVRSLNGRGRVIALDRLEMAPIPGVTFVHADFAEQDGLDALCEALAGDAADLVLSDMAPNLSGVAVVDQMGVMHLAELALDFCAEALKPGGDLLVKLFQGEGFDALLGDMRHRFECTVVRKPQASRAASREQYLLGRGWRG
jgi:23S rRNA (uridine2552-2'-O)-methyltransferase